MTSTLSLLRLGILFFASTAISQAATVLVPGGSWSNFTIDMDGNGQIDFAGVSTASSNLTGTYYKDFLTSSVTGPSSFNAEAGTWHAAANPGSVGINGTYTVTGLARSMQNSATSGYSFYNHMNLQSWYTLIVGNSGNSGEAANLIAFYVDGRDYYANNANPIKFNYAVYGPLTATAGGNTATVNFTTVPEPSVFSLFLAGAGALALFRNQPNRSLKH